MTEIEKAIQHRRSIYPKNYTGEIIDDVIIEQLLESANWAPTHKLTEPWRFTVFKGMGLEKLAHFQSTLYREKAEGEGTFEQKKFDQLSTKPQMCSHVISIGMKRNPVVPEVEEISAVACAAQNIMICASAHGLGSYWGSGGITYYEEAKPFFDLGKEDKLLGFIFLGKYDGAWPKGHRKAISDKVRWVK